MIRIILGFMLATAGLTVALGGWFWLGFAAVVAGLALCPKEHEVQARWDAAVKVSQRPVRVRWVRA